jgi:hypothetical protein
MVQIMPIKFENPNVYDADAGPWDSPNQIPGSTGSTVYDRNGDRWTRNTDASETFDSWSRDYDGLTTGSSENRLEHLGPFTNERKQQVATLVSTQHAEAKAKLAELKAQLDKVQESLAGYTPDEPIEYGTVVRFRKFNQSYTYAAIKVPTVGGTVWYLTQNPTRTQDRKAPKSWDELLDFIGERNYDTIEVLS